MQLHKMHKGSDMNHAFCPPISIKVDEKESIYPNKPYHYQLYQASCKENEIKVVNASHSFGIKLEIPLHFQLGITSMV